MFKHSLYIRHNSLLSNISCTNIFSQSLMRGSNSWAMRSWPELKLRVGCLTNWATQVPQWFVWLLFLFKKNIYLFLRGEVKRERERVTKGIPSRFSTSSAEPKAGLDLRNLEIMTWDKIKSQMLNWLSHPGIPQKRWILECCKQFPSLGLISFFKL